MSFETWFGLIGSAVTILGFLTAWIWHGIDTERYEREHRELLITLHTHHEDLLTRIGR